MLKKISYPLLSFTILFYSLLPGVPLPEVVLCIGSDGSIVFFRPNPDANPGSERTRTESGTTVFAHDDCLDISVHTPGPRIAPVSKRYTDHETRAISLFFSEIPAIHNLITTSQNYHKASHSSPDAAVAANPVLLI